MFVRSVCFASALCANLHRLTIDFFSRADVAHAAVGDTVSFFLVHVPSFEVPFTYLAAVWQSDDGEGLRVGRRLESVYDAR